MLLFWDRFSVSKPLSQIQRRTLLFLQQASYTPSFGGLGLKGCTKCGGDLVFDDDDWRCWQCGYYYYAKQAALQDGSQLEPQDPDHRPVPVPREEHTRKGRRNGYGPRSERNINAVIRAKYTSDERWWARNRQTIEYLDQGLSVREVSSLLGLGERQIRVVRERLADLRAATGAEPKGHEATKGQDGGENSSSNRS